MYLTVVGAALGSFLHLLGDRLPRGEPVTTSRSRCRACGRRLTAVDLLPIAGYLVRRGRCASCGAAIPVSCLLAELAAGATMLLPILWLGLVAGATVGVALLAAGTAVILARSRPARHR